MPNIRLELAGQWFGCLFVQAYDQKSYGNKVSRWICTCHNCGWEGSVASTSIKKARKSCRNCKMEHREYASKGSQCTYCAKRIEIQSNHYAGCCDNECRAALAAARSSASRRVSMDGTLRQIVASSKARAKKRGLEFDLTAEFLMNLAAEQSGCCARTGVPLEISKEDLDRKSRAQKNTISIDRVDTTRGYTKDNVELVSYHYNVAKNAFTSEETLEMAKSILTKAGYVVSASEGRRP